MATTEPEQQPGVPAQPQLGADDGPASPAAEPVTGAPATTPAAPPAAPHRVRPTLAGRVWIALGVAAILLILLVVFIAENSTRVKISFFGSGGHLPLGVALVIAAVVGALVTLLVGSTRIVQLRREIRRIHRHPH
jgi:uncharacterized integral membrane protein